MEWKVRKHLINEFLSSATTDHSFFSDKSSEFEVGIPLKSIETFNHGDNQASENIQNNNGTY